MEEEEEEEGVVSFWCFESPPPLHTQQVARCSPPTHAHNAPQAEPHTHTHTRTHPSIRPSIRPSVPPAVPPSVPPSVPTLLSGKRLLRCMSPF